MKPEACPPSLKPTLTYSRVGSVFWLLLGVVLPVIALVFELITGGCAEILFDPIPTWLHVVLVAAVPLANFLVLRRTWGMSVGACPGWLFAVNAGAILLSLLYALAFGPVTHVAVIGILAMGLGALALSPLCSLIVACLLWGRLLKWREADGDSASWVKPALVGMAVALVLGVAAETPRWATVAGVRLVQSHEASRREAGMWLLRHLGSEETLFKACYGDQFGLYRELNAGLSPEEARKLYYRVTGEPFNLASYDEKIASGLWETRRGRWDRDLGGTQVGQVIDELALTESRLDGVLYPKDGTGYVEWTMIFHNADERGNREARFVLRPPPGGVVSRVTLWVNGEPREAAFGPTAQVREAYRKVAVRQRRDPLLVTALGPDQVLAQCFPVPAGGEMKIRLGISFPLTSGDDGEQWAALPEIVSRNFVHDPDLRHSLWYEGPGNMTVPRVGPGSGESVVAEHDVTIEFSTDELADYPGIGIRVAREEPLVAYSFPEKRAYAVQRQTHVAGDNVLAVVDGSSGMRGFRDRVTDWLRARQRAEVWFAGDEVTHFAGTGPEAADWLSARRFIGGQDSVPALAEALSASLEMPGPDKAIWWFNAGQPVMLTNPDRLQRYYERRDPGVEIVGCPLGDAVNRLRETPPLAYAPAAHGQDFAWQSLSLGNLPEDVEPRDGPGAEHLCRIVVASELRGWLADLYGGQSDIKPSVYRERLAAMAQRVGLLQIVTPLTGAVVLETQRQYEENDLTPSDPDEQPSVPEPAQAALVVGLLVLAALLLRQRMTRRNA